MSFSTRTQAALDAYVPGSSIASTAAQFGIHHETLRRAVRAAGIGCRAENFTRQRWTDADDAQLRDLVAAGCTYVEIAARLDRTPEAVRARRKWLVHLYGELRPAERGPDRKTAISILCNGKGAQIVASTTQTVARCVTKRGGGYIVTTHEGGSGWSSTRYEPGARVVILPGGEVQRAFKGAA